MEETIGKRIAARRKEKGYTQEEDSGTSWPSRHRPCQNGKTIPHVRTFLCFRPWRRCWEQRWTRFFRESRRMRCGFCRRKERRSIDEMTLRILVDTAEDNDRVRVSVPMALVRVAIEMGMQLPQITSKEALKGIDINSVFRMVENGVIGKLMEVETGDGTTVTILVE